MHAHKTSHTRRPALAGLALLAAVIAAASNGQVSGATAAPDAGATAGEGAASIHDVDFFQVAVPGSVCGEGLRFDEPRVIPVRSGRSPVLDLTRLTQVAVDPTVAYADLDGDGDDEAVVRVSCTFGANGIEDSVHVWALGPDGQPVHVGGVGEPDESVTGALPGTVAGVAASDGVVEVTWTRYAEDDPNCCPSQHTTVAYGLVDGGLVQQGDPVVSDVPAPGSEIAAAGDQA
ncbi:MAG: LppP/LprE family lipoprotein [Acidimicrobiia bacterium]